MRSRLNLNPLPDLLRQWQELVAAQPRLRTREAACKLGCSEAELVAAGAGMEQVHQLAREPLPLLLASLVTSGPWMYLLRNEAAVLEVDAEAELRDDRTGHWTFTAENLRIDLEHAAIGFAFLVTPGGRLPRSVQLFSYTGEAILKLYLKDKRRIAEVDKAAATAAREVDPAGLKLVAAEPPEVASLPGDPAPKGCYRELLAQARDREATAELRAGNAGRQLTVRRAPKRLEPMEPWFNILDRGLNLHLREDLVAAAHLETEDDSTRAHFKDAAGAEVLQINVPFRFSS